MLKVFSIKNGYVSLQPSTINRNRIPILFRIHQRVFFRICIVLYLYITAASICLMDGLLIGKAFFTNYIFISLSFIEQLFVNDEADIIPNIMCLAKRLMVGS